MERKAVNVLLLSKDDVSQLLSFKEVIDVVEESQRAWGNGQAVSGQIDHLKVPLEVSKAKHGNFLSYSGFFGEKSLNVAGLVWTASCIHNPTEYGLPYAVGLEIINDTVTGVPLAVMERSRLTEMVTAGSSAVGAKYLARKDSQTVGIIGCGSQGRTHLQALKELFNIRTVKAFDVREESLKKYVEEMSENTGISVEPCKNPEEIIRTSDIAVLAISPVIPIMKYEWIKQGSLIIAMCGGTGWAYNGSCLQSNVDKFISDNYEGTIKLKEIISGKEKGRENEDEKIVFAHSGVVVNHIAAGYFVYKKAQEKGIGTEFRIL